jgi:hypothetical protein
MPYNNIIRTFLLYFPFAIHHSLKILNLSDGGPITLVIFAEISGAISSSDGCGERVDEKIKTAAKMSSFIYKLGPISTDRKFSENIIVKS